ncbi:hypothetical protein [Rothia sp. ZJ932]|uniref:hypothetical protein n=1 Tax=Rothia sp. ZJ932 TaxID=2810516 RepID=UPI0019671EB0|nr:hypothetical protein [Rothia sp. ZJ932]QRZ61722.1 hypothetical protein JR346_00820 [Rothia sp. ZJ932]
MQIEQDDVAELLANDGTLTVIEEMTACLMYAHAQNYAEFEQRTAGWDPEDKKAYLNQTRSLSASSLTLILIKRLARIRHAKELNPLNLWHNDWFEFRHKEVQIYLLRSTSTRSDRKKELPIINTIKNDKANLFDESGDRSADIYRSRISDKLLSVDNEPLYCQLKYTVGRNGMLTKAVFSAQTISLDHPIFAYTLDLGQVQELLKELLSSDPEIFAPATLLRQNTIPSPAAQTHQLSPVEAEEVGRELDTHSAPALAPTREEDQHRGRKSS